MDKVKQWKPGQLVTVNGIVCRVTKMPNSYYTGCMRCAFYNDYKICDDLCRGVPFWRTTKLPDNCYLKKLKER